MKHVLALDEDDDDSDAASRQTNVARYRSMLREHDYFRTPNERE
jgi:hypothetical protein